MSDNTTWINDHLGDMESLIRSVNGYRMDAWRQYMTALERGDTQSMIRAFETIMASVHYTVCFHGGHITLNHTMDRIRCAFNGDDMVPVDDARARRESDYSNTLWVYFSHLDPDENILMVDAVDAILSIGGYDDLHKVFYRD